MLTTKHYKLIAEVIKQMPNKPMTRAQIADVFCRVLKRDNPRFKEQLFLVACLDLEENV